MAVQAEIAVLVVGYNSVHTERNTGHSTPPTRLRSAPEFCWGQR